MNIIDYEVAFKNELDFLVNESFGNDYALAKDYAAKNSKTFLAIHDEVLIGACSAIINNEGILFDFIVVAKNYRNRGVGRVLFEHRLKWTQSLFNQKSIKINHWVKRGQNQPFLALTHGFKFVTNMPNYWAEDSLRLGYICAECVAQPCTCTCSVYELKI